MKKQGIHYPLPEKYKYSIAFTSILKPIIEEKDEYISLASKNLDNLRKFLPKDIDFNKKIDMLPICGNAFVANKLNFNDDGVTTKQAIEISKLFPFSYIDLEHDRTKCLGVILSSSFSEFGTDKKLSLDDIKDTTKPFNVVIGGVIWKVVNEDIADKIEESNNPKSKWYQSISTSWELAFSEFDLILIDSNKDNIEDGKIIKDSKEISELETKLKSLGGSGKTESGKRIGRLPTDAIPLGIGLTVNPAGQVGSIAIPEEDIPSIKLVENQAAIINTDHRIEKCSCGKILFQCRCSFPNKPIIIIKDGCEECKAHAIPDTDLKLNQEHQIPASIKDSTDTKVDIKKPLATYNILPPILADKLKNAPESGMGYHTCDLEMNDGTILNNINISNCSILPDNIDGSKINNISIKEIKASELSVKNNNENIEKIEKSQNFSVNQNNHMKLNSIKDITDESIKQCNASDVNSLLDAEVRKISDKFENDKKTIEDGKKEVDTLLANTKTELDSTKKTLVEIQDTLKKLQEAQAAKAKEEAFTIRMNAWDNDYELDAETKEVIASDIKDLDEKGYEAWAAKMKKIVKDKKKGTKPTKNNPDPDGDGDDDTTKKGDTDKDKGQPDKKTAKASVDSGKDAEKALDKAIDNGDKKEIDKTIDASKSNAEPTLKDKYKASFGTIGEESNWFVDPRRLKRMK